MIDTAWLSELDGLAQARWQNRIRPDPISALFLDGRAFGLRGFLFSSSFVWLSMFFEV